MRSIYGDQKPTILPCRRKGREYAKGCGHASCHTAYAFNVSISEENAASTEETNASMQELNATFAMISDSASKLQTIATDLTDTISYFNT